MPSIASKPIPADYKGLRSQYDELVAHVISLDKNRKEMETELDELRKQSGTRKSTGVGIASHGWDTWQVIALLVVAIAILKGFSFL